MLNPQDLEVVNAFLTEYAPFIQEAYQNGMELPLDAESMILCMQALDLMATESMITIEELNKLLESIVPAEDVAQEPEAATVENAVQQPEGKLAKAAEAVKDAVNKSRTAVWNWIVKAWTKLRGWAVTAWNWSVEKAKQMWNYSVAKAKALGNWTSGTAYPWTKNAVITSYGWTKNALITSYDWTKGKIVASYGWTKTKIVAVCSWMWKQAKAVTSWIARQFNKLDNKVASKFDMQFPYMQTVMYWMPKDSQARIISRTVTCTADYTSMIALTTGADSVMVGPRRAIKEVK